MSKDQIKSEINKVLDHFSDKGLEEILHLLKKLDSQLPELIQVSCKKFLKKIVIYLKDSLNDSNIRCPINSQNTY